MHYLSDTPLRLQGCGSIYVCVYVRERERERERFKLILAELGITIKFKQNSVLCSLFELRAIFKMCISWHPRKSGWGGLFGWVYLLPFWRWNSDTRVCAPNDHLLCPCLESRDKLYMWTHVWNGPSSGVKGEFSTQALLSLK